ncbi:unnamed protein product [Spirodela intermedia]|uniref:Uncharacterized protein n=2 Tax=Spirodela intermedia TaxID=51605 RepID=A0A7I8IGC3_SPIIN|nr:unnamed protein product [Spirodela intermedia]CAA6655912.1 unnamed protein product [Spirodela intermedia]CAA7391311.1 unnamed protein product [Spirodela intermedia]
MLQHTCEIKKIVVLPSRRERRRQEAPPRELAKAPFPC